MTDIAVRTRLVSRVLLLNADDRVLLFDTQLAYTRVWSAPGGALEPDETFEVAALRELEEETGLSGVTLGRCVCWLRFRFQHRGTIYDQLERYFTARVDSHEVSRAGWSESEASQFQRHHWWSLDELATSPEFFRPLELRALMADILGDREWPEPLRASVEPAAQAINLP
jgi:ADP-ribose pyrophosphatase YjhB (NUDIX family)